MNSKLKQFIEQTLLSTSLPPRQQLELKKELASHIEEQEKELQLQGYSEEKIVVTITDRFGSPEKIGHEFFVINREYMRTYQRNGLFLMGILSVLLIPYFGPDDPITLIINATFLASVVYFLLFAKKYGTTGLRYVLSLTIILLWGSIVFFHQGAPSFSGTLYGTIGFPLPFYREHVRPSFSLTESLVYFTLDYIFFLGISWISYITVMKRFWRSYYNILITSVAFFTSIAGFMWLLWTYD
jgi:hypothetical protein